MTKRGNGEGSIHKRADGRWVAVVTLGNGRRKYLYAARREDVARRLTEALKSVQDGAPMPSDRQTVAAFLDGWLPSARNRLRPRTFDRYEQLIRIHALPEIGRVQLARLAPQHLGKLYSDRVEEGLSPTTVVQLHRVLRRALLDAVRWGLAVKNVADLVDPPRRATSEIRPLSLTETQTFLAHADSDRFAALYVLAITTGMRQGELLGLHWRDIDLSARVLRVRGSLQRTKKGLGISEPKTSHSRRQVELAAIAVEALRDHQDRQQAERSRWPGAWADLDLVFPNEIGRPVEAGNLIRRSFWPILDRAGLRRIRFHDLRHTAATLLLAKSVHPKVVSEMLGHSRIGITLDLYSHVTRTMQREATDAMDDLLKS